MNYQNHATFSTAPPYYNNNTSAYYDNGQGIPKLTENNMTIQDIYRTPFLFTQEHKKNYVDMSATALKSIQSESELSKLFFSDKNFKRVQNMIKKEIYNRTRGEFKLDIDQDQKDLFIVMRAIYVEHSRNLPGQIVRQVKRLNNKVIEDIVPSMITEIKQYYGYLKDINKPIEPIMRPLNVSNAGRLSLPSTSKIWG
jgi:hypothetical protein